MVSGFELFDKKLIVLFVLNEAKVPLSIAQITKLCQDFENITYFDICEYVDKLKLAEYIKDTQEKKEAFYELTYKGDLVLEELAPLVPGASLHNLKKLLTKEMSTLKKDYEIGANMVAIKYGEYKVSCYIKDGNDELLNITLYAGDKESAKRISDNWTNNYSDIYSKTIQLMTNG